MPNTDSLPIGLRLRRARRDAGLTQRELAERVGVSQPLISYYERSAGDAVGEGLTKIAAALGLELEGAPPIRAPSTESDDWLAGARRALLDRLKSVPLDVGLLDRPADGAGGDVAFALDLGSHVMLAVVDGTGSGVRGTVMALLAASALVSAAHRPRGIPWPEEVLEAVMTVPDAMGLRSVAALWIGLVDQHNRELTWASTRFPAALLRSGGRVQPLRGRAAGGVERGRTPLAEGWLLLVATDGLAHLPSGRGVLMEARDTRQLVSNARRPAELVDRLAERIPPRVAAEQPDDRLAIAVASP